MNAPQQIALVTTISPVSGSVVVFNTVINDSLKSLSPNNKTFDNLFGFESGVDITDETKVLYRRNNAL